MIKLLKIHFLSLCLPLQGIIILLIFVVSLGLVSLFVSLLRGKKVHLVKKSEKEYIEKLGAYNRQYCELQYETMRKMIYRQLSIHEAELWLRYFKENDFVLHKGERIYADLKLARNKNLCNMYEKELIKYKISKLYNLLICEKFK